jgi:hypothetical protein
MPKPSLPQPCMALLGPSTCTTSRPWVFMCCKSAHKAHCNKLLRGSINRCGGRRPTACHCGGLTAVVAVNTVNYSEYRWMLALSICARVRTLIGGGWDGSGEHKTDVLGGGLDGWVWRAREQGRGGGRDGISFFLLSWRIVLRCVGLLHWPATTSQCEGTQRFLGAVVVPDPLLGRRCGGLLATRMRAAAPSAFTSTADPTT